MAGQLILKFVCHIYVYQNFSWYERETYPFTAEGCIEAVNWHEKKDRDNIRSCIALDDNIITPQCRKVKYAKDPESEFKIQFAEYSKVKE